MSKNNFKNREQHEQGEALPIKDNGAPIARFQAEQQVNDASNTEEITGPAAGFAKKKTEAKGSVLKQDVAATVVAKGVGGDVPDGSTGLRTLAYSGNEGTILGSTAYTPSVGQSRSDSRFGKKLDATAKKINYVASEQVELLYEGSKSLAQNPDAVQGYNGTVRNTNARSQKTTGGVPGDLLFQRSLDEICRDHIYWSEGQVVKQQGMDYRDVPTYTIKKDASGVYEWKKEYDITRGNFLHRNLKVKFDNFGRVTQFKFTVTDASCVVDDSNIVNQSSSHQLIDMNVAEIDRQNMDAKAGDEKAEIWTVLARAVKEPTQTVGYLRDLEAITGSEVYTAYKKTAEAYAYNLNRSAKDGLKTRAPMIEALNGCVIPEVTSKYSGNLSQAEMYNGDFLKYGPATLFLAINDSAEKKINTKADMLVSPKSILLALQTADNNMNPLRVKKEFISVIDSNEVFSTIDREYDPLQPVCISDKVGLIHVYNFNKLYSFDSLNSDGEPNFTQDPFKYMYDDLRNKYVVTAELSLLSGIHAYLNSMGSKFRAILGDNELTIPMVHSGKFFSLWSLIVLASTPFICMKRVNSMKDVLYYEKNVEYPFSQLTNIGSNNPLNNVNFDCQDFHAPIKLKRMAPSQAITWVMPEFFWPMDELTTNDRFTYVLPWYFNQSNFDFTTEDATLNSDYAVMSYPEVRSGSKFGYLQDIIDMDERQVRLSLDRLTDIPQTVANSQHGVYKYGQNNDGLVAVTIDGSDYTYQKFLALPRELGLFMVAPYALLSPKATATDWTIKDSHSYANVGQYASASDNVLGQTSYLAKRWHGRTSTNYVGNISNKILVNESINVSRASAYVQDWDAIPAVINYNATYGDPGFCMSMGELITGNRDLIDNKSVFIPFTNGMSVNGAETQLTGDPYKLVSFQKAFWTRIQLLPFVISPWDAVARTPAALTEDGIHIDIYDFAYMFGFCGFKASDYREDVYNRSNEVINQGFGFINDPFVAATPLINVHKD